MAAASIVLGQQEKLDYWINPAESWNASTPITTKAASVEDNHPQYTLQDLTGAARDPPAEEILSLEIERLCSATLAIDRTFYDIGNELSDALNVQNKRVDVYNICFALGARWNEYHLTYQTLLWRSRVFAGEAQSVVDDFREVILTSLADPDTTRLEKQDIMHEQIKVLQDTAQPSQNLCQEFLDFGRSLDGYIAHFSEVVENLRIGEKSEKVAGLKDRLSSAKTTMEALSQEVKKLGWKLAADVAITGISLLLAFVVPILWENLAGVAAIGIDLMSIKNSGIRLHQLRKQRKAAVKEYKAINDEYNLEKPALAQMLKLESALDSARPQVQEVTVKLGIFASVWAAITADIRGLENSLHRADDPTSKLFSQRVQRLEKMYGYLSQALRHYQVTVRLT